MARGDIVDWATYCCTESWYGEYEGATCASDAQVAKHRIIPQRNTESCEISQRSATRRTFKAGDRVRWVDGSGLDAKVPYYGIIVAQYNDVAGTLNEPWWTVEWDTAGLLSYPESCLRHLTFVPKPGPTPSQPSFRCQHFPSAIDNWYAGIQLCKYGCTDYKLEPWHNGTRRSA
jgi:hypothetical protein